MATSQYNYIDLTGTIVPDTETTRLQVEQEYKDAFGQDLIVTPDTPQGVLITGEVTARDSVARNNAALANQINPNLAGGVALDAICALTDFKRSPGSPTTVPVTFAGEPGTLVSVSVQCLFSTTEVLFSPVEAVTIGGDGTVAGALQAATNGPITILSGVTAQIQSGTGPIGLETVVTTANSTPGTTQQSDASTRQERRQTIGIQGSSQAAAIIGAVSALPTVKSLSYRENVKHYDQTIDGVPMGPNSIFVCVDSGTSPTDDTAVATAIASKKGGGCDYSVEIGTPVNVTLNDPASRQTYVVTFARPDEKQILAQVTVSAGTFTGDPITAVQSSIVSYANGEFDGEPGFEVGDAVSAFELAGAVNHVAPGLFVRNVLIAVAGMSPVFSCDEIPIALWEVARITASQISVTVV